jgi:uncharacterized protein (DUF4415 family)
MKKLAKSQSEEIRALRRMKDKEIDLTDIPEVTNWGNAVVGKFYRPIKKSLTIRIDADVLAWLKGQGKGYQTRINGLLREAMKGVSSGKDRSAHARRHGLLREAQMSSRNRPRQSEL